MLIKRLVFIFFILICVTSTYSHPINEERSVVSSYEEVLSDSKDAHHNLPNPISIIPFILLLLMIATGPLFYPHFWHKSYPKIAISLGALIVGYYIFLLHNIHSPVHSAIEYIQFIVLLAGLFVASGGVLIHLDRKASTKANIILLAIGAVLANVIGTTGASMLLIRPYIRLNKDRVKPYHIVFFIFIVSNVGGCLTPIGDPPLFLGFLKGIPFTWTLLNNFLPWVFAVIFLLLVFLLIDRRNKPNDLYLDDTNDQNVTHHGKIKIRGKRNFIWLTVIVITVFLDPNIFSWIPGIMLWGQKFSYIRECIMIITTLCALRFSDLQAVKDNEFSLEPIREVGFLFVGIFFTMMPALELISQYSQSPEGSQLISANTLYWGTGLLSGFLDNAPTYINFLTASLASQGGSINNIDDVIRFANNGYNNSSLYLMAISLGAVYFGAATYIGNGPNFMVKSIAEQVGIRMPSFFTYIFKYSIPILLPMVFLIWLLFIL